MSQKVYQIITDQIIEALEQGTVPWNKPWNTAGYAHSNLVSKKAYRGINALSLMLAAHKHDFSSNYWVTFNQAKKLGGTVKKGSKSTPVLWWNWHTQEDKVTGEKKRFPTVRYYRVFNLDQTEGLEAPKVESREFSPIEAAQSIADGYPQGPSITHQGGRAFYMPADDSITMPVKESFHGDEEYYSTLFHEMTHSTGHKSRLNRDGISGKHHFGSEDYSKEELVAEMGAAFLCGVAGIENKTVNNSAAYIENWLKNLKKDPGLVIFAAQQAQKAADHIQGIEREGE